MPARPYQILFATRSADGKPTPLPEELVNQAGKINAARAEVSETEHQREAKKLQLINWVETFFSQNYRDITARKTLEWGEPETTAGGNLSIRYKYLATIWNKDQMIIEQRFTFTPEGKYVSAETVEKGPATQPAEQPTTQNAPEAPLKGKLINWVETFFSQNYRDITARKTLEWGEPETTAGGGGLGGVLFLEHKRNGASCGRPNGPGPVLMALDAGRDVFSMANVVAGVATAQDVDEPGQRSPSTLRRASRTMPPSR